MVTITGGRAGLGVSDLARAVAFYRDTLGLEIRDDANGAFLHLPGGAQVFLYPRPAHEPAAYTAVYLDVADIDVAVAELRDAGVALERYEGMPQDELGVMRGRSMNRGPDIGWFLDPEGNTVAVLQD